MYVEITKGTRTKQVHPATVGAWTAKGWAEVFVEPDVENDVEVITVNDEPDNEPEPEPKPKPKPKPQANNIDAENIEE